MSEAVSPQATPPNNTVGKSILAARRMLQIGGISPRTAVSVYNRPHSGARIAVISGKSSKPTPAAAYTTVPVQTGDRYKIAVTPSQCDLTNPFPSPASAHSPSSRAASPSVTRTVAMLSSRDEGEDSAAVTLSSDETDDDCHRTSVTKHPQDCDQYSPLYGGYAAYRRICFSKTGNEIVLAVSELGDRVAAFFSKEQVASYRMSNGAWSNARLPTDIVSEILVQSTEDAQQYAADMIGISAGVAAAAINVTSTGAVFGVLAATASAANPAASRYFALFCGSVNVDACFENSERFSKSSLSDDTFIFAQTAEAEKEFNDGCPSALFSRAYAVIPIVHIETIEDDVSSGKRDVMTAVHNSTSVVSHAHVVNSLVRMQSNVSNTCESVKNHIVRMRGLFAECLTAKNKKSAAIAKSVLESSEPCQESMHKLAEMASVTSCIEEVVGATWSNVETIVSGAENIAAKAVADVYVAARVNFAPRPYESGAGFSRAVRWGYPQVLDGIDYSGDDKSVIDALESASELPGIPLSLREAFVNALNARKRRISV